MAFFQYLNFDGVDLPLPDSYEVDILLPRSGLGC